MARLTAAARRALPDSAFAGPNRTYPIPDKKHAAVAKAYASRYASPKLEKRIDAKANRKLGKKGQAIVNRMKG